MSKGANGKHRNRGYKTRKRLARSRDKAFPMIKNQVRKLIDSGVFEEAIEQTEAGEVRS